jgi:hypothetical protein
MISQDILPKLTNFMSTLLDAGCSPDFTAERGYHYAVQLQREEAIKRLPVDTDTDATPTEWMAKAAIWVLQVSKTLEISTDQRAAIMYQSSSRKEL